MGPIPSHPHLEAHPGGPTGASAADSSGRLTVTLDADGRVASVAVPRLEPDDALREAGPLTTALQEAWERARFYHQAALPVPPDEAARLTKLGEDFLAGRFRVEAPDPPPRPSETAPSLDTLAARAKLRGGAGLSSVTSAALPVPARPAVVRDGGLRIEVAVGGRPRSIVVDADWIARASAATLAASLTRALSAPDREDVR